MMSDIDSPCIGVCRLNKQQICDGCKRTSEEIENWLKYSDDEKLKIIKRLNINNDISGGGYYADNYL